MPGRVVAVLTGLLGLLALVLLEPPGHSERNPGYASLPPVRGEKAALKGLDEDLPLLVADAEDVLDAAFLLVPPEVRGEKAALKGLDEDLQLNVADAEDVLGALRKKAAEVLNRTNASEALRKRWRSAQMDMLERTKPIRAWLGRTEHNGASDENEWSCLSFDVEAGCLSDEDFFTDFCALLDSDPTFFLGLVYIPMPWKFVLESAPRRLGSREPVDMVQKLMGELPKDWKYFTLMQQAHMGQFNAVVHTHELWWDPEAVLVFDSRGMDSDAAPYPRVPVPLLSTRSVQNAVAKKKKQVFFSAKCRDDVRKAIGTKVFHGKSSKYDWRVRECNHLLKKDEYVEALQQATWVITPTGTMPTSFAFYETLQAGGLPILPYSRFVDDEHPWYTRLTTYTTNLSEPFVWLPYRDIGVEWHSELAELVPWQVLPDLKKRIEGIPFETVQRRLDLVRKYHPLFTSDGLTAYILYVASLVYHSGDASGVVGKQYALGRAVTELERNGTGDVIVD